ncbi:conserved hypothetical protein [Desulforapulum autotrophicum HRM2]|uniref:AMIN domain-containing protein n=1 Tax=Desulforapulum autotrophicum (strain ATCC 43914 / DSM 3382 / VKM B-1955 / HRM2) TaxID=177437 RepID=C0QCP6_DESAH|nr:DUF1302 family protein [Desulforapulum autotrophicum]ACN15123.1 conserved hypothetical protein [Desulforapulum autotrophicum HRM2]
MFAKTAKKYTGYAILLIALILTCNVNFCLALPLTKLLSVKYRQTFRVESIELWLSNASDYVTCNFQNPDRFVIDVKNCYFPKIHDVIEANSKYISKIRISQFMHDRVRIVVDQKIVTHIHVDKKALIKGMVLILSIQLPESGVIFGKQGGAFENDSDENLDALFNVSEEGANAIPDIIPNEETIGEQPSFIGEPSKLSIDGDLRNETAYRICKPHRFSKIKNILNLKASGALSGNLSYTMGSRFSYDAVFDLNDNYNNTVENDQRTNVDIRDAYLDFGFGNFDFRLGNQQIVWGQAVGLFFADVVNPKDLREYILPDLDQVRIPVFAANMEYYYSSGYFQMIFIPFPEFNEFGKSGSEFDFSKPLYSQNADIVINDLSEPANSLDNSELGFRASILTDGWDMSLFYLYDMYNFPVNYRAISLNALGLQHPVTITYSPKYERVHRIGSTFSKAVWDAILKGEFIYSNKMFFQSSVASDLDGIETSDSLDWLLGVDYTFFNALETNFQLMQSIILDYQNSMIQKEITTSFSIWLKTGFFENLIEPELFFVSSLDKKNYLFRPKITYNHNNRLKLVLGADIFYGETDGSFGVFNENDRVYIEALYNF